MALLTKDDILRGLRRLDAKARAARVIVDMAVYGGAALALVFDLRQATRDVDAVVRGAPDFLRRVVGEVAEEEGWPIDWLNDGVKGFLSNHEDLRVITEFQASDAGGLRLYVPVPEYLFAMKCMAMRPEGIEGSRDILWISKPWPKRWESPMRLRRWPWSRNFIRRPVSHPKCGLALRKLWKEWWQDGRRSKRSGRGVPVLADPAGSRGFYPVAKSNDTRSGSNKFCLAELGRRTRWKGKLGAYVD